jgi:hypothetical protein
VLYFVKCQPAVLAVGKKLKRMPLRHLTRTGTGSWTPKTQRFFIVLLDPPPPLPSYSIDEMDTHPLLLSGLFPKIHGLTATRRSILRSRIHLSSHSFARVRSHLAVLSFQVHLWPFLWLACGLHKQQRGQWGLLVIHVKRVYGTYMECFESL